MTTYNETVSEDLTADEATPLTDALIMSEAFSVTATQQVTFPITVTGSMTVDESILADQITQILEHVNLLDTLNSQSNMNVTALDLFEVADLAAVLFGHTLLEDITVDDTLVEIKERIQIVLDQLAIYDTTSTRGTLYTAVAVALALTDLTLSVELISEDLTIDDALVQNVIMALAILEDLELVDTEGEFISFYTLVEDTIIGDDSASNTASLHDLVLDGFQVGTKFQVGDATYTGWVMNPENYAISTYSNFSFNSVASFQNAYLLASSSGLFSLGGTLDETTYITSRLKTASMNFGSTSRKQIPEVLLGVNNSGQVILTVAVDGQHTAYYKLVPATSYIDTQQIKVGKGLHGRYWQFELVTYQNSTFDLDTFEFLPVVFGRKLR